MSAELFSRLPYEVLPGVFLGNEFHAASLETLRVLDIVAVLNVGLPQCQDHFRDRGIRYLSCELFDNAESNFSSVFLHQAYPFITAACETKNKILVHCKSGFSKSPAIMAAFLMLRFNMDVVGSVSFLVNDAGCAKVKISDHLLGELLLLQDSKEQIELPKHSLPDWEVDEQERPEFKVAVSQVEALWNNLDLDNLCKVSNRSEAWSRLVRLCVWNQPAAKLNVSKLSDWCSLMKRYEQGLPEDLFACVQFDQAKTLGSDLAQLLNKQMIEGKVTALEEIVFAVVLARCHVAFEEAFGHFSKERMLGFFYGGEEDARAELERSVASEFGKVAVLRRLGETLGRMIADLIHNVKPMTGAGRVLVAAASEWNTSKDSNTPPHCNIPECLANVLSLPAVGDAKKLVLQPHLGVVECKFGSVSIAMPTDVFCVLDVFNQFDEPVSKEQIHELCKADRLDDILTLLTRPIARTKHALILLGPDRKYAVNSKFESKAKKLEIKW